MSDNPFPAKGMRLNQWGAQVPIRKFVEEIPADDQTRIIGVELAATDPQTGREEELAMYPAQFTFPPVEAHQRPVQVRVTLHTSKGDVTLRGELPI